MILTIEQQKEKAVQHVIVFARFAATEYCKDSFTAGDVLRAAAERVGATQEEFKLPEPVNAIVVNTQYRQWLRAAYRYYITPGEETGMPDAEWDRLSRQFFADRHLLEGADYGPIHRPEFTGGSLFWLKRGEYPEWARS